ncbi:MAG: CdvA-like protein [Candidatus Bathyarchaeia archaeon]
MSIWKYSFELSTKELEVTRKKKQALDNLYSANKISKATYETLEKELSKAITELEGHLESIKTRMATRAQELEQQISTLELFLASLEIHHAAGDLDDETYEKQNKAIQLGLEATRQELDEIRMSTKIISQPTQPKIEDTEPEEPIMTEEGTNITEETEDDLETDEPMSDQQTLI